jgi:hypothetical protein
VRAMGYIYPLAVVHSDRARHSSDHSGRIIIESCIAVDSLMMALLREPATRR